MSTPYTPSNTYHTGAITIPTDTDAKTMTTLAVPIEAALDNAAYAYNRVHGFQLVAYFAAVADSGSNSSALSTSGMAALAMAGIQSISDMFTTGVALQVGDVVVVDFTASVLFPTNVGNPSSSAYRLLDSQNSGAHTLMPGSAAVVDTEGQNPSQQFSFLSRGVRTITSAGIYSVQVQAAAGSNGGSTVLTGGSASGVITVYRAN